MQPLQIARIVPGSESPTSEGTTKPVRCTLILPDGSRRAAVVKRGPTEHIAAEVFSAQLLRGWGLNVPEPFIIEEPGGLAFASADAGYPSLSHRLSLDALPAGPAKEAAAEFAAGIVLSLKSTPLAAAADEAIDNRDRNLGNVLWDGNEEAWIDHAFSLGNGGHLSDNNLLCLMANLLGTPDAVKQGAVAHALAIDHSTPTQAQDSISHPELDRAHADFVVRRLGALASRVLSRFPKPADLLSGA